MCATVGSYRRTYLHHRTGRPDRSTSSTSVKPGRQDIGNPQGRTLRTWNDVMPTTRGPRKVAEPPFMDGRYLAPGHTDNVRTGFRCVDGDGLESGDDQTLWRLIDARGSPSRKDAPRGGREEPPRRTGRTRPIIESVATLPRRPTDGELGSPESPQGAEFKQGPVSASLPCGIGSGADGRAVVSVGPQQQDDPRHFEPHLQ